MALLTQKNNVMKTKLFFSLLSAFFLLSFYGCSCYEELEDLQNNTDIEIDNVATRSSVSVVNLKEYKKFVEGNAYAITYFWAPWCGPCKIVTPTFEKLSEKYKHVEFLKVDIDEAEEIANKCEIKSIPTIIFYKGGNKIDQLVGANNNELENKLKLYYKQ